MIATALYSFIFYSIFSSSIPFDKPIADKVTFTVIYDNYSSSAECTGDWGFSCLIEGYEKTVLFDTGTKPEIFKSNLKKLNVDLKTIDVIVISHNHGDHTGGLPVIQEEGSELPLYIPVTVEDNFLGRLESFRDHTIAVNEPVKICDGIMSTGEMGGSIKEQSLLVDTPEGLVVLTGCSHQGVENIVEKATELSDKPIYMVFGGFHLINHSQTQVEQIIEVFRKNGVQKCGATHCTGTKATDMFKEEYGSDFVIIGAGNIISL
jgi:7,8-dihydropterin-6-yl-methyl-4-(beta-D-ribofuranosyl)aminobenzene 5'-phosphate synthase